MMKKAFAMRNVAILAAVAVVVYLLVNNTKMTSTYRIKERNYATVEASPEKLAMKNGTGLASSLLPREVASQDDFGEFAPEDILKGQNFLEPRQQVGMPETVGGALRNANQQIRAEPPVGKEAYVWNNSTITPDLMQRGLCA
ncbi:hypothetical protein MPVG_00110 [Micromonas pusilla virus 12T]|jgi:hypothetical protein|uniref:hypothetical protein n=1 Tax=Micromonas pusilla virus 12T TaxID=755272 RepID=UPI00011044C0|nr:hypothetical protein MPVG_00110 [Micromonas pusilla virus 12T]AGH30931.1 hypothetical protein MPVG_00110 [Micromonas pusilla virus 12T]|tara:strand:- start:131 stop:556 length:426 start_codon:yes stop_codon:yes gene_type:complete